MILVIFQSHYINSDGAYRLRLWSTAPFELSVYTTGYTRMNRHANCPNLHERVYSHTSTWAQKFYLRVAIKIFNNPTDPYVSIFPHRNIYPCTESLTKNDTPKFSIFFRSERRERSFLHVSVNFIPSQLL